MKAGVGGPIQVTPRLSYIVCSTPRSGSSMLGLGLFHTGVCGFPDEYFNDTFQLPSIMKERNLTAFPDYLDMILRERGGSNGVFSVKLHWNQFEFLQAELSKMESYQRLPAADALRRMLGDPRYIYVTRKDKVRQAVSWLIASQTKNWVDAGDPSVPFQETLLKGRPKYDYHALCHLLQGLEKAELSWKRFFLENSITPLEIVYEEMVGSYEETINRVLEYLDLKGAGARRVVVPPTKPQSSRINEIWARKYIRARERLGQSRLYGAVLQLFGPGFAEKCATIYSRAVPERVRAFVRENFE